MARCWYVDPEERPNFSELCSIMDQFLSLVSDYTELKMVLVEDANGRYCFQIKSPCVVTQ